MDERILRYPELDIIFYEQFNQNQLEHVIKIIRVLAQYILLDTEMLMRAYKVRYKDDMGLSFLKRAVKYKLIIEYSEAPDAEGEGVIYYYALKPSLHAYLNQNKVPTNKLPFTAAVEEKSYLLTFNRYALAHRVFPLVGKHQDDKMRFFLCQNNEIHYFSETISEDKLLEMMGQMDPENYPTFVQITAEPYRIGKVARVVYRKELV